MFVTPAVAGTTVYAGSCAGVYYAFDLESGAVRWSHDFKPTAGHATFHGDPLLRDDVLVTGTEALDPPRVYAFDPVTGAVLWQRSDRHALTRSDVVAVGDLAVGRNEAGELVALDVGSGQVRWVAGHDGRRYRPDLAESPAVVGQDVVYSAPDGALYRIDGRTGAVIWRTAVDCDVTSSVTAAGADVYVGCRDGRLYRLAAGDGGILGSTTLPTGIEGRLAVTGDLLVVPGGVSWIGAVDRGLDGIVWEHRPRPGSRLSVVQPHVANGRVLTGTADGRLVALDPQDGSVLWTARLEGQIRGLGEHGSTLLVGTIEGFLFAVVAPDGHGG